MESKLKLGELNDDQLIEWYKTYLSNIKNNKYYEASINHTNNRKSINKIYYEGIKKCQILDEKSRKDEITLINCRHVQEIKYADELYGLEQLRIDNEIRNINEIISFLEYKIVTNDSNYWD